VSGSAVVQGATSRCVGKIPKRPCYREHTSRFARPIPSRPSYSDDPRQRSFRPKPRPKSQEVKTRELEPRRVGSFFALLAGNSGTDPRIVLYRMNRRVASYWPVDSRTTAGLLFTVGGMLPKRLLIARSVRALILSSPSREPAPNVARQLASGLDLRLKGSE
jgi:hypothetical protein